MSETNGTEQTNKTGKKLEDMTLNEIKTLVKTAADRTPSGRSLEVISYLSEYFAGVDVEVSMLLDYIFTLCLSRDLKHEESIILSTVNNVLANASRNSNILGG